MAKNHTEAINPRETHSILYPDLSRRTSEISKQGNQEHRRMVASVNEAEDRDSIRDTMRRMISTAGYDDLRSNWFNSKNIASVAGLVLMGGIGIYGLNYYQNGDKKTSNQAAINYSYGNSMITKQNWHLIDKLKIQETARYKDVVGLQQLSTNEEISAHNGKPSGEVASVINSNNDEKRIKMSDLEDMAANEDIQPRVKEDGKSEMKYIVENREKDADIGSYERDIVKADNRLADSIKEYEKMFNTFYNNEDIKKKEKNSISGKLLDNYVEVITDLRDDISSRLSNDDAGARQQNFLTYKKDLLETKRELIVIGEQFLDDVIKLYKKDDVSRNERKQQLITLIDQHRSRLERSADSLNNRLRQAKFSEEQLHEILRVYDKGFFKVN